MLSGEFVKGEIEPKAKPTKKWYERGYHEEKMEQEAFWRRRRNELRKNPVPRWLADAEKDPEKFMRRDFLSRRFLKDSVFYTCAGNDGRPIRHWAGLAHSFIYMDSCYDENWVGNHIRPWALRGYDCFFNAKVPMLERREIEEIWHEMEREMELGGKNPDPGFFSSRSDEDGRWHGECLEEEFKGKESAAWICLLRRTPEYGPEHGPRLLSVCLIAGGAVTYYYHLFNRKRIAPKALCTYFPGMCDWVGIHRPDGAFRHIVRMNRAGLPKLTIHESLFHEHSLLLYKGPNNRIPPLWSLPEKNSYGLVYKDLVLAADNGEYDACRQLLRRGADPNSSDRRGWTALHGAVFNRHKEIAELLLKRGAEVNAADHKGMTPLMYAVDDPVNADISRLLVKMGADVNAGDGEGRTVLMLASMRDDNCNNLDLLVRAGASINAVREDGETALSLAARRMSRINCEFLLKHGADPNGGAERGWTPLCGATVGGCSYCFRMLVKNGADFNFKGQDGSYFHELAEQDKESFIRLTIWQVERMLKEGRQDRL